MEEKETLGKKILSFIITTMNGMAYGLFATLIIGTILKTIGGFFGESYFKEIVISVAVFLQNMTGLGIGVGIALALKLDGLKMVALSAVGALAAYLNLNIYQPEMIQFASLGLRIGDPLTIYLVVIGSYLLMKLILVKKTPVDIVLIPFTIIIIGTILTLILAFPIGQVTRFIGYIVEVATDAQPFFMGIIIAVVMGMALTAPISSAAIAAMILTTSNFEGPLAIAGGAAVVGCSVQMVGFAIQSIYDNKVGTVISVGIGTSMLQFKNILKNPKIWLPTIITSAILGPFATCLFKVRCVGSSAGMGTSGLVGQIGTIATMGNTLPAWLGIIILQVAAPAALVFGFDLLFRKIGWIKKGDLTV